MSDPSDMDARIKMAMSMLAGEIRVGQPKLATVPIDDQPSQPRRPWRLAALVAAAAVLIGLVVVARVRTDDQTVTATQPGVCPQAAGTVFLVGRDGVLREGSLCPFRFTGRPDMTGVRSVSANDDTLATTLEDGMTLANDHVRPSEIPENVSHTAVAPDGRWAYVTNQPARVGAETVRLYVRDPSGAPPRPLAPVKGFLGPVSWGPDGRLAVVRLPAGSGEAPALMVEEPDGTRREFTLNPRPSLDRVINVAWGSSELIAVAFDLVDPGPTAVTLVLDPSTGEQRLFRGWHAIAWSPDGSQLLVQRDYPHNDLALVKSPDFDTTVEVGKLASGATAGAWVACSPQRPCQPAQEPSLTTVAGIEMLEYSQFLDLARQGRVSSVDVYESSEPRVEGGYVAADGSDRRFLVQRDASAGIEDVVQEIIALGVPVSVHD